MQELSDVEKKIVEMIRNSPQKFMRPDDIARRFENNGDSISRPTVDRYCWMIAAKTGLIEKGEIKSPDPWNQTIVVWKLKE